MNVFRADVKKIASKFVFLGVLLMCITSAYAEKYPVLSMQGEEYVSACEQEERKALRDQLLNARNQGAMQVWRVVEVLLCAPDDNFNRAFIKSLIPGNVRRKFDSTGDHPKIKIIPRSDRLASQIMANGKAWDVGINFDSNEVTLQYFANEACVKEVRLRNSGSRWIIYEVSEACD
jgi:hypothetical protein